MHSMSPQARLRPAALSRASLLLAGVLGSAAFAGATALPSRAESPIPQRPTPAQEAQIFPQRKAALLRHQRERIEAMQSAERCLSGAEDSAALRQCMHEQGRQLKDQARSHRQTMDELYKRNGMAAPRGRRGGGGPGPGQGRRDS
jgi:hypothetical protein